jgi:hypothetical protein
MASSTRSLRSFTSTSVAPPTRITATPPASLASRSCNFCRSYISPALWTGRGERARAADLLAPVYGWFTEGFDTADLKEAKSLLDELA